MFALAFALALFAGFIYYLMRNYDFWLARGVSFPKPVMFFGNFRESMMRKRHLADDFSQFYYEFKGTSNFIGVYQMREPRIMILDPELVNEILIKKFNCFKDNEFSTMFDSSVNPIFSRNIFLSGGDKWKEYRSELSPAFSINRLKSCFVDFPYASDRLNDYIRSNVHEAMEARELSVSYVLDIFTNCLLNVDAEYFSEHCEVKKMSQKLMKPTAKAMLLMVLTQFFPVTKNFLKVKFVSGDVEKYFFDYFQKIIENRLRSEEQREDFLDAVLTLLRKKNLSSSDIAGHLIVFFADGLDSTSSFIAHTLYELARNTNVQQKLREEIEDYSDDNDEISFDDLNDMPYLDQVLIESLRLHPSFPFLSKQCTESVELNYTASRRILIERGTNIYIPIYQMQTDAEYFARPNEFQPERFDKQFGGEKVYRDKGVLIPFGNGSRMCIGMKLAQIICKSAVVDIVRNFKISINSSTCERLQMDPNYMFNVKEGGLWLDFKEVSMFKL